MNYKKNDDGTYTAFKLMKDSNYLLEITAHDLDEAKDLLRKEVKSYREGHGLVKTKRKFNSAGKEDEVDYIWARHDLADKIDTEVENEEK
jgi:hypothetical protein